MNNSIRRKAVGVLLIALIIPGLVSSSSGSNSVVTTQEASQLRGGAMVPLHADHRDFPSQVSPPNEFSQLGNQTATIYVTYIGFPEAAKTAFQRATNIWASQITSPVPIWVTAEWTPLEAGILGFSGPVYFWINFPGTPVANTWYPDALADKLAGFDLDPFSYDIVVQINSNINWYFGTDGNPPAGQFDLVTTGLHMIGLGLGFASSMEVSSGQGGWGWGTGYPFIYDRFLINGFGQSLINTNLFPNPSGALAAQLTSNNLFFNGPSARLANSGIAPRLYAPNPWQPGLSISHLDEGTYPPGNPNALMTPFLNSAEANHDPGPVTRGILQDMGWTTVSTNVITEVEINQALGRQYGAPKFVAGKDTAIRVFLSTPVTVNPAVQRVVVRRSSTIVKTLYPEPSAQLTSILTFLCPDRAACGNWQVENYTFDVSVNGLSKQATAAFQQRRTLRILAVPVKVKDKGVVKQLPDDQWKTAHEFLRQVYPIASNGVDWKIFKHELDATDLDLTQEGECPKIGQYEISVNCTGRRGLWVKLRRLQPLLCLSFQLSCYDKIIGFIPPMSIPTTDSCTGSGFILGWTAGDPANIVMVNGSFTKPDGNEKTIRTMQATVAHEVGHTFLLGEEYDQFNGLFRCAINPPPYSYVGRNWESPSGCNNFSCPRLDDVVRWSDPDTATGSMIRGAQDRPFEVGGRGPLGDMLSFMGSGGARQNDYWVTPRVYSHLFNQLSSSAQTAIVLQQPEDAVQVFGWIGRDDSVTLEPLYHFTATLSSPVTGTYTIEAVDAVSQTLAYQGFEVSFLALTNPPQEIAPAPFGAVVAFPAGTKAFRIKHGNTVLRVIPVSLNKPTVTVTVPTSGQMVSGNSTITWQSSDLDGDQLYHIVQYSHNDQDWLTLAAVITETQFVANFDALPGGNQAHVRVTVSDGVNTTEATSAAFVVGIKPPEVFIESPAPGTSYALGTNITLFGNAYDLQDGWLRSDAALVWSSDRDGVLGRGEILNLHNLSAGQHTITLSATNSRSMTTIANVTVIVNGIYLPLVMRNR